MKAAAREDVELRRKQQQVTKKLTLLNEFVDALKKRYLHRTLLERNVLDVIAMWLQPAVKDDQRNCLITRGLLRSLLEMSGITQAHVERSYIGQVVVAITKRAHETNDNKLMASELIYRWARLRS
uniref:TFIIS N-terminal domain-containing protein n=1 Tax=Anopheles epiroticus TaxID=199890 RepID=A0A182PT33_9DIPT